MKVNRRKFIKSASILGVTSTAVGVAPYLSAKAIEEDVPTLKLSIGLGGRTSGQFRASKNPMFKNTHKSKRRCS